MGYATPWLNTSNRSWLDTKVPRRQAPQQAMTPPPSVNFQSVLAAGDRPQAGMMAASPPVPQWQEPPPSWAWGNRQVSGDAGPNLPSRPMQVSPETEAFAAPAMAAGEADYWNSPEGLARLQSMRVHQERMAAIQGMGQRLHTGGGYAATGVEQSPFGANFSRDPAYNQQANAGMRSTQEGLAALLRNQENATVQNSMLNTMGEYNKMPRQVVDYNTPEGREAALAAAALNQASYAGGQGPVQRVALGAGDYQQRLMEMNRSKQAELDWQRGSEAYQNFQKTKQTPEYQAKQQAQQNEQAYRQQNVTNRAQGRGVLSRPQYQYQQDVMSGSMGPLAKILYAQGPEAGAIYAGQQGMQDKAMSDWQSKGMDFVGAGMQAIDPTTGQPLYTAEQLWKQYTSMSQPPTVPGMTGQVPIPAPLGPPAAGGGQQPQGFANTPGVQSKVKQQMDAGDIAGAKKTLADSGVPPEQVDQVLRGTVQGSEGTESIVSNMPTTTGFLGLLGKELTGKWKTDEAPPATVDLPPKQLERLRQMALQNTPKGMKARAILRDYESRQGDRESVDYWRSIFGPQQ